MILNFTIFIWLLITTSFDNNFPLDSFQKRSAKDVFYFEKLNFGEIKDTLYNYGIEGVTSKVNSGSIYTTVFIFNRKNDNFNPNLHVWYHFDKSIKDLKAVKYQWGLFNPSFNTSENMDLLMKLSRQENAFKQKYKKLQLDLIRAYGNSIKIKTISDNETIFWENTYWENKTIEVRLSLKFNRKLIFVGKSVIGDFNIEILTTFK